MKHAKSEFQELEQTHFCCNERLKKNGITKCCACDPHEGCEFNAE